MGGVPVRFATAEDLLTHKLFAGRPRDLEDARGILLKQPHLGLGYVRAWLGHLQEGAEVDGLGRLDALAASIGR